MTIFYFIFIIFIFLNKSNSQQYIYISSTANNNGDGSINNPFNSLCSLNNNNNNLTSDTIINISYGVFNSSQCTLEINNLNNIAIIPYNKSKNNNNSTVDIYNINFNIYNSNHILISNINFYLYNSNNNNNNSSSILFNNVESTLIINNLKIVSKSNYFIYSNGSNSSINSSGIYIADFKDIIPIINLGLGRYSFKNTTFNNCKSSVFINIENNNNLEISNVTLNSNNDNFKFLLLSNYISTSNLTSTTIIISNFKIISTNIHAEKCSLNKFITTPSELYSSSLSSTSSTSSSSSSSSSSPINIYINNSYFECFGSSDFRESNVEFNNIEIKTIYTNSEFIKLGSNSSVIFKNSVFKINSYENSLYFISVYGDSTLKFEECQFQESSLTLINSNVNSNILISNSQFMHVSNINQLPFINLADSNLTISGVEINSFTSSKSSFINSISSEIIIENSNISNSLFGSNQPIIYSIQTNLVVNEFQLSNCVNGYSYLFEINDYDMLSRSYFKISNSTFVNNHSVMEKGYIMFYFSNIKYANFTLCNFNKNSFSPLIHTISTNVKLSNIVYQDNRGSFLASEFSNLVCNDFKFQNNKIPLDYLFAFRLSTTIRINQLSIINNYLGQFLFYSDLIDIASLSSFEINNLVYQNNSNINEYQNQKNSSNQNQNNNIQYPFPFKINLDNLIPAQFIFNSFESNLNFIDIQNNELSSTLLYFNYGAFNIINSVLSNNQFLNGHSTKLISSFGSRASFTNTLIENNFIDSPQDLSTGGDYNSNSVGNYPGLIYLNNSNALSIISCNISYNSFPNSKGGVFSYELSTDIIFGSLDLTILNSNFISNSALLGGSFYLYIDQSSNVYTSILNNSFISNYAKDTGAVFYNAGAMLFDDVKILISRNTFLNNLCLLGENIIGTGLNRIYPNYFYSSNGEALNLKFSLLDNYDNYGLRIVGNFNTSIKYHNPITKNFTTTYVSTKINSGNASLLYTFYSYPNLTSYYIIGLVDFPQLNEILVHVYGCPPFKYYIDDSSGSDSNNSTNSLNFKCIYCPIGSTFSDNGCQVCDSKKATCQDTNVFSHNGYFMVNWDPSFIYSCPLDMCFQNNTCQSNLYSGDLCQKCSTGSAKNGIQCCEYFHPKLLISLLFIIVLVFSFSLSIIKYHHNIQIINSIIIFIQINSVIFYSYSGIYLLPVFRFSIDLIDGYCLFNNLNYLDKSLIIYFIIVVSFLISLSDVSINIIQVFNYKMLKLFNSSKKNYTVLSKFIKRIRFRKKSSNGLFKLKAIYSLSQLFIIPILFNSLSLIIYKEVYSKNSDQLIKYLALDFSMNYLNSYHTFLFILSLLIIIILSSIIIYLIHIITMFNNINNNIKENNHNNFHHKINQLLLINYKKQSKYWDLIIIAKNTIFILLSLLMLFNSDYYLNIILITQIIYSCAFFIIKPIKDINNNQNSITNYINFFQTLIILISQSTLYQQIKPFNLKGIIITSLIFSVILFITSIIYYKLKPNRHK